MSISIYIYIFINLMEVASYLGILSIRPEPNRLKTTVTLMTLSAVYLSLCPSNITCGYCIYDHEFSRVLIMSIARKFRSLC